MPPKSPNFWQKDASLLSWLLSPAARLYQHCSQKKYASVTPVTMPVPVICVGNVTAGGAGKTPVAIAIAKALQAKGKNPVFLSRGYGGKLAGPVKVDPATHHYSDVGDEPLLLSRTAPVFIAKNRVAGAEMAAASGADIIIMDDGFQNPSLTKDISLLVVDGSYGFGNGKTIPAGPLREPLQEAFARATACIMIGNPIEIPASIPVLEAILSPENSTGWQGKKIVAFAGIGNPQKFFTTLETLGADIVNRHSYPDHYPYTTQDIEKLSAEAKKHGASLVTTEKDWVRIPPAYQPHVLTLPVAIAWQQPEKMEEILGKSFISL